MSISTYADHQAQTASEKTGLCILEATKRVTGFSVYSGSVYSLGSFDVAKIVTITDSGVALAEVTSIAAVTAGTFYNDRDNHILYLRTAGSTHPNGRFLAMNQRLYFSTSGVNAANDLATGFDVHWLPMLLETSEFGVGLDNQQQLGVAIEGSGSITLMNDHDYWTPIYDGLYFENQRVFIYSWSPTLPITEAKLVYRGRVQGKDWYLDKIVFQLKDFINELRSPVALSLIGDYPSARVPDGLAKAFQRRLYGYLSGYRPTNIDHLLGGYPLTGTVSVSALGTALTGSGTSFLSRVSPGDQIIIGSDADAVTVQSVTSDTAIVLSEAYAGITQAGVTIVIKPDLPKPYMNRKYLLAGHALTSPSTTVSAAVAFNYFQVASVDGFRQGDPITVGSVAATILRLSSNTIFITTSLSAVPSVGAVVTRDPISNVYIDGLKLQKTRDYTFSASAATLTLTSTAEMNVAPTALFGGSVSFTNGSRSITGTAFKAQLKPGDWLRANGQLVWLEVGTVTDDTNAELRIVSSYTANTTTYQRRPNVYVESKSVLSCDVIGISDTGLTSGSLVYTGPGVVYDLLSSAGLGSYISTATFTAAKSISRERLGVAIPYRYSDTKSPAIRDVINLVNQSVFGSLIQDVDFNLAYSVLDPRRSDSITKLDESDALTLSIKSNSDKIVGTSVVEYLSKEYDFLTMGPAFQAETKISNAGTYLAGSTKEFRTSSLLVDQTAARIMANRWAFIFEVSSSVVQLNAKLQLARVQVGDRIEISHPKLYSRVGSAITTKVAGVQIANRSISASSVELEDLANAFSRCGIITPNAANSYLNASNSEKIYNGFITDNYGMILNDPSTMGVHLIY